MKIAIEGCLHGELDNIYSTIQELEELENIKIDLLICCGDFQACRNVNDLACMAVPAKYRHICSFYKYYSGEKKAPILTVFIGGNHEASNYLQELPYGGWVAPNIYYLGYAGVINIGGLRIGGLSGIYKSKDFLKGRYEMSPYDDNSKRSVYHIRNLEVFRLKQLSHQVDIFLSHDWPAGIYNYGNIKQLLKKKPYFKNEIDSNELGSQPCGELLKQLKPKYWFSAHLHCKFAAVIPHEDNLVTKFLALDKCLPKRNFLQIIEVPHDETKEIEISYDLEWLTILYFTNHLLNIKNVNNYMPGPGGTERHMFTPTEEEKSFIFQKLSESLVIPKKFNATAIAYDPVSPHKKLAPKQPPPQLNPQTTELCELLGIDDPITLLLQKTQSKINGNLSFLDTMIDSVTLDSSKDEELNILQEKRNSSRLSSMKLPEAKYEETDASKIDRELSGELNLSNFTVDKTENDKDFEIQANEIEKLTVSGESQAKLSPKRTCDNESCSSQIVGLGESPNTKKFKRRNAEIYASGSTNS